MQASRVIMKRNGPRPVGTVATSRDSELTLSINEALERHARADALADGRDVPGAEV
jgi:hypothetical protein